MSSVISVSLGRANGQKANAPLGSRTQSNIILHTLGLETSIGSGWDVWFASGSWYHLGGTRSRKPTIYRLQCLDKGVGWVSKGVDQTHASKLYELIGK